MEPKFKLQEGVFFIDSNLDFPQPKFVNDGIIEEIITRSNETNMFITYKIVTKSGHRKSVREAWVYEHFIDADNALRAYLTKKGKK